VSGKAAGEDGWGETIADPLLREAVEIDGFEETRHKQVLSNLVSRAKDRQSSRR
jgi:hypothetical protein